MAGLDLIASYKRRRYSSPPRRYDRIRVPSPRSMPREAPHRGHYGGGPHPSRVQPPSFDRPDNGPRPVHYDDELLHILNGSHLPAPVFDRLEHRFRQLKHDRAQLLELRESYDFLKAESSQAVARGRTIQKLEAHIHHLKHEQDQMRDRHEEELAARDEELQLRDELLHAAGKAVEQKKLVIERLEREKQGVEGLLEERENEVAALKDLVAQFEAEAGSGDVSVQLALESQAQRTLAMVQGLQATVAEQREEIERLSSKLAAEEFMRQEAYEQEGIKKALEASAAEAKSIVEDQDKLINRLMEENARLQSYP